MPSAPQTPPNSQRCLIAGLGSPQGDDQVGWVAATLLALRLPAVRVVALRSPAELLDRLTDVDRLHVIDACRGAGLPGSIVRLDWPTADLESIAFEGTHNLGLEAVLRIGETLALLPPQVTIWGIEMADPVANESALSAIASRSVAELIEQLVLEI